MSKVFISRKLSNGLIQQKLELQGYHFHDESLIEITSCAFSLDKSYDWIFFYSKNGIRFFLDYFKKEISAKIIVMGAASNAYLKKRTNKEANHIAKTGIENVNQLNQILEGQTILFVQAKNSIERFQNQLTTAKNIDKLVAYENTIKENIQIPHCEILVFTSPLNAKAYFNHYNLTEEQTLIAIGPTTAKMLKKITGREPLIPEQYDEQSILNLILNLNKS